MFLVFLGSVLALSFWMILPYMLAVTMGGILALLCRPAYIWLRSHNMKPKMASLLVTLGMVLLIIAPISLFVTKAIQQGIAIGQGVAQDGFTFREILDRISSWGPVSAVIGSPEALEAQIRRWIQGAGAGITTAILNLAGILPNTVLQLALASLSCFFLLIDGDKFLSWSADKIPVDSDVRMRVVRSFKDTSISVILATLAAAAAQAAVMMASYAILGVPAAFLAGGATFIFAWIPIVGSTPVWLAGAIYLYAQGSIPKALLMLLFGMLTGIVDNFVRPLVLKGRSNMHPLVSLVAIFGGIGMFGIMGVFIGPIIVAVLISLLQIWPEVGYRFGLLPGTRVRAEIAAGVAPEAAAKGDEKAAKGA